MKKIIFALVIITSYTLSYCKTNDKEVIICGKAINSPNTIILLDRFSVLDSKQYNTMTDSSGYFKFVFDYTGFPRYGLSMSTVHKIPVFVNAGDSLYVTFDQSQLKEYHDYLLKPIYKGVGSDKNQHFYPLLKDRWAYQDTAKMKSKTEDSFVYRDFFINKLETEQGFINNQFNNNPQLDSLKIYALEDCKFYWFELTMRIQHKKRGLEKRKFLADLDSLGYYDFFSKVDSYNDNLINIEWFGYFINEYLFYLFFTKEGEFFFDMTAENQIEYIKNHTNGVIQKACLEHFKKRYVR